MMYIPVRCIDCGKCVEVCPEGALSMDRDNKVDWDKCTFCLKCVEACRQDAMRRAGEEISAEELYRIIEEDRIFYGTSGGGVTLSGGEPLSQPDFITEIFRLCRRGSIHTALDTSGLGNSEDLVKVLKYVDLVLLDIKQMDPIEHIKWTGVSNDVILKNARIMAEKCEVRISLPLVSGVNNSRRNIEQMAEFAKELGIKAIDVEPLHKLASQKYKFLGMESPFEDLEKVSDEEVEEIREIFHSYGLVTTKGRDF